jgi:ligand-binding sensor domain-containing protein
VPPARPVRLKETKTRISSTRAVEAATCMTRNGLIATCFVFLLVAGTGRAHGVDPSRHISQYAHTAWRVRDGYFQAPPLAIAQTKDGQLWLGGEGGLLRFDGVQFSSWKPPGGQALPGGRIYGLLGSSDGSLWIGTGRGLAQWKNDRLTVYSKAGRFSSLIEDRQGTIWAGHTRAIGILPPLCRFAEKRLQVLRVRQSTWYVLGRGPERGSQW